MKREIIFGFGFLMVFATSSCRKDPKIYPDADCYDINYNPDYWTIHYSQPDTGRSYGRYNPNNENEICYFYGVRSSNITQLRRHNFSSGLDAAAFSGVVWSFRSYGINGWLIFNYGGSEIWKVKDNGDSLTRLTFDGQSLEPYWDWTGQKYIFRQDIGSSHRTIICNKDGQHLDTIAGIYWHNGDWSNDNNMLVSIAFDNLKIYSFSSGVISTISGHGQGDSSKDGILDVAISPDSRKIYWCNGWGIFYYDLLTGDSKQIQTSCDARRFNSIDISPDGHTLLCNSTKQKILDYNTNTVFIEAKMYTMKLDGSNCTEVQF